MEALSPLGINLGYLAVQIVNFGLLLVLLNVALFGPIGKTLRNRRETIAEGLNKAREADEALANAEADKKAILDEARSEAQKIVSDARSSAEIAANQIKSGADEDAKKTLAAAEAAAAGEYDRQLADMREQIISLSVAAANHLIGENLDEKKQHKLVEDFFTAMPAEAKGLGDSYTVVTAVPLTDSEMKQYQKDLGTDDVVFQSDPSILGGVIVRSGGQQVDNSFANQLSELRTSLN